MDQKVVVDEGLVTTWNGLEDGKAGPLVRSSYHAHETADAYKRAAGG